MSVQARSNGFGSFSYTESAVVTTKTRYSDGSETTSQTAFNAPVHTCQRAQKSKNWYKPVAGTNISFRQPSSYDRGVRNVKWTSGSWEKFSTGTSVTYQLQEGYPYSRASLLMLDVRPHFAGHYVSIDNNLNNQAKTEALLKLKGKNSLQLGADLLEAKSTVNMLSQSASSLGGVLKLAKQGKFHLIPKQFKYHFGGDGKKVPANMWLELQYGWLPLMKTIFDYAELSKEKLQKDMIFSVVRNVKDFQSYQDKELVPNWISSGESKRVHTCKLYASISDPVAYRANQLGITNPASIAWEATRLSFVIDWLVPIGDFLDALSATMGLTFVGGYTAQWGEAKSSTRLKPTNGWQEVAPRSGEAQFYSVRRQRLTGFPAPAPWVQSPFSTSHVGSAIALIHQLKFK